MGKITGLLLFVLPFLSLAETFAKNIDPDEVGIDDTIAFKLREIIEWIELIVGHSTTGIKGNTVARGFNAIQIFGKDIITTLEILRDDNTIIYEEKIKQATTIGAYLSDPNKVYQAKKGDDATLLQNYKITVANIITAIKLQKGNTE